MEWIWILSMVLEVVKMLVLSRLLFGVKVKRLWPAIGLVLLYCGAGLLGIADPENLMLIAAFYAVIAMGTAVDLSGKARITHVLKCLLFIMCLDYIVGILLEMIIKGFLDMKNIRAIVINIVVLLIAIPIYKISKILKIRGRLKESKCLLLIRYLCVIGMGISMILTIAALNFAGKEIGNHRFYKLSLVLSVTTAISVIVLFLYAFYMSDTNKKVQEHLDIERALKQTQQSYYEAMLQKEDDTKRFRHDLSNHMICLHELVKSGRKGEALDYMSTLEKQIIEIQKRCYSTGNVVIDAVLNDCIPKIEKDVQIQVNGKCPDKISVNQVELCIIFSNLMNNAVEALYRQQGGKRFLNIHICAQDQQLTIEIRNSCEDRIVVQSGVLPKTRKKDSSQHGIGLRNVEQAVEKCGGIFQWNVMEQEFLAFVILPLK